MKKILSLALVFAASISVNAQEVCQIDAESAGITSTAAEIAGGTVVGTSENLTITVLNTDNVKSASCKMKNSGFVIGGAELKASGITGSTNPKNAAGANPATDPTGGIPTTGFALQFDVKADGYLYVCGKFSSNKNYYVFEQGLCIGYDLAMWCDDATQFQPLVINVANDAEADGVPYRTTAIAWPEVIFTGDETSAVKKNGEGVIKFPVYANCSYVVGAGGSKISCCGAVYSTSNDLAVVLPETTDADGNTEAAHTIMGSSTGITEISAAQVSDLNAPAYNIAGQRVNRTAKGLVICNGKKYVNK